jgi:hypothetical protein
MKDFFS